MPTQIYKVTTYLKSNTNPRKWFNDTLWECLEDDEDILETKIEQIGSTFRRRERRQRACDK